MTTTPVMSITDEQIAEIEYYALCGLQAAPANILALISRLRAAEKDAERYRFIRDEENCESMRPAIHECDYDGEYLFGVDADTAIDAAMEQSK